MLDINLTIDGDKAVIGGLERIAREMPDAVQRGLTSAAEALHRAATDLLSGPNRKSVRMRDVKRVRLQDGKLDVSYRRKTRKRGQFDALGGRPGSYPVPVLTGHLRRSEDYVPPGKSKSTDAFTFRAGRLEAILYNSARYASVIHDGTHSSTKFGRRPFMDDAFKNVDVKSHIENELKGLVK